MRKPKSLKIEHKINANFSSRIEFTAKEEKEIKERYVVADSYLTSILSAKNCRTIANRLLLMASWIDEAQENRNEKMHRQNTGWYL